MSSRLWSFKWDITKERKTSGKNVASFESYTPLLVPATKDKTLYNVPENSGRVPPTTVNVVRDYPWTYSKPGDTARAETPRIIMKEKRLKTNAFISSIAYSFANATQGVQQTLNFLQSQGKVGQSFVNLLLKLKDTFVSGAEFIAGSVSNAVSPNPVVNPTTENVQQQGRNIINELANFYETKALDNNPTLQTPLLEAYQNLYPSVDTGWQYVFPYFDDYFSSSQNIFGDDSNMNVINLIKAGAETLTNIAGIAGALAHPFGFSFQEKAKFYNFPSEGEEFSFTFPLINTGNINFNQVIKNWQLIFLLLYQNKPSRVNRNIIEPPVFYEVAIPGQKFYPFCYITNISVDFKGARRELNFNLDVQNTFETESYTPAVDPVNATLPGDANNLGEKIDVVRDITSQTSSQKFSAIIPDAYVIKITLKSLVTETRNFMAYTILGSKDFVQAKIEDLDAVNGAGLLGNSNNTGVNNQLQPGANTPVNYRVGGWPDSQATNSQNIPTFEARTPFIQR